MPMFPAFHNLNDFKCSDPKQTKLMRSCSAGPITHKDGICFLVTLAFLFPVQNIKELKTLLTQLLNIECEGTYTISDKDAKDLYEFLDKYNPFENRRSFLQNKVFLSIVKEFKKIIYFRMGENQSLGDKTGSQHIKEASEFLKCNIALCDVVSQSIQTFPLCSDKEFSEDRSLLTLYVAYQKNTPFEKFYTIGIDHSLGEKLQEKAIRTILREGGISPRSVENITPFSSCKGNITLTLLNKNMVSEVGLLFRQPSILLKIAEAGYDVDPTIFDSKGKSALYYAIEKGYKDLVLQFCFYLVNLQNEITLQNRPFMNKLEFFLKNLQGITSVLTHHKSVFEQSPDSNAEHIVFLEQLLKINHFHIDITQKFLEIAEPTAFTCIDASVRKSFEAKNMNIIFSTYMQYFNYEDSLHSSQDPIEHLLRNFASYASGFSKYEWFYNMLDFITALLFFDNLFSLRQSLDTEDRLCEEPESAFFHFVFTSHFFRFKKSPSFWKVLPKTEKKKIVIVKTCFHHIVCIERLECLKYLQAFNNALAAIVVKKKNAVDDVQDSFLEPLKFPPVIRDVIIFQTVLRYLDVVSELKRKIDSKKCIIDEQTVLVIERALQVVGESLNERFTDTVSLGKSLLVSALPARVRKILRDIRDKLSHIDSKTAEGRKRIEGNRKLFSAIMEELQDIESCFVRSYLVLELIEYKYMFQHGIKQLEEMQSKLNKCNNLDGRNSKHCIPDLLENVGKNIQFLGNANCSIQRIISTSQKHYTVHLRAHFDYLIYYMSEVSKMKEDDRCTKILFHLQCSDVLLKNFLKCDEEKLDTLATELQDLMDGIKNSVAGNFLKLSETKEEISETSMDGIKNSVAGNRKEEISETSMDGIKNSVAGDTKEEISKTAIIKKVKEKVESVMGKCQSVCQEAQSSRKSNANEKKKNKKQPHTSLPQKPQSDQTAIGKTIQHPVLPKAKSLGYDKRTSKTESPRRGSRSDMSVTQSKEITEYPKIEKLADSLKRFYPITTEEQQWVLDSVSSKFKNNHEAKISLECIFKKLLDGKKIWTDDVGKEIKSHIGKLVQSRKTRTLENDFADKNLIKNNLEIVSSIRDDYGDLSGHFHKNEMIGRKNFDKYCKNLELTDKAKAKSLLEKCVDGSQSGTVNDAMLRYLRDKVIVLEKLLIASNPRIDRMWREENIITKQQVAFLIKEQYVRDRVLQAAVEMLLFDCVNILKYSNDWESLWIKTTNLFGGINLRNILAHGNPLFRQIGFILDPNDLPSEIIAKCLELVDDRKVIEAMCKLLEGTDGTNDTLISAMRTKEPGSEDTLSSAASARESGCKELCDIIRQNEKWKGYASLLLPKSGAEMC